jgi:uncharacterized protein (TIGR02391 family)
MDREQRADWLLAELAAAPPNEQGENLILFRVQEWFPELRGFGPLPAGNAAVNQMKADNKRVEEFLRDAYQALMTRGHIVPDPTGGKTFCRVTEAGHEHLKALQAPDADRISFARLALKVDLHPALQNRYVDDHFRQGKFETAIRDGATFLEDAIRTLANLPSSTLGVTLASQAFGKQGALTDPSMHPGEQQGLQRMFEGFFGAVRNRVAHKDFRYKDPKEALQVLMYLDMLTTKLAAAAHRTGQQLT